MVWSGGRRCTGQKGSCATSWHRSGPPHGEDQFHGQHYGHPRGVATARWPGPAGTARGPGAGRASSFGLTLYTYRIDLDVVAVSVPYLFAACAQLTFPVSRRRRVQGWLLARDLLICGVSVLFSLWVTFASGYQAVYQALILVLAGIVLYAFLNARRERLGQIPEPADNPPDDTAAPVPADTQREPAAGKGET